MCWSVVCVLLLAASAATSEDHYQLTDEQYYQMPELFHLDEYEGCLATGGVYCLGSFELTPEHRPHELYDLIQRYSANWVDHFNHSRLHRGHCLSRTCASYAPPSHLVAQPGALQNWFSTCVNGSISAEYNLSAHLYQLDYCHGREEADAGAGPLSLNEQAFAGFVAILVALAVVSTTLDLTLSDHAKKGFEWALAWSVPGGWRTLCARPKREATAALDGLRVLCMLCVIVEHVCWINTHAYLSATRQYEQTRRDLDVIMMANSTLVVQIFFLMSSFLLAHKLLQQRRRGERPPPVATFLRTMLHRIIRVSPSYLAVVWFAASWWERRGRGPMWGPLVGAEARVCRRKWWTHLLYLNNLVYPDDKCLIQTWYLAADMQLYAAGLALTLVLWRWRRAAVAALGLLLGASVLLLFGLAYSWSLVPTYVMHRPESVRVSYRDEPSFNAVYQSPAGNAAGALAGLLLAHAHHLLLDHRVDLARNKVFVWGSRAAAPLATWWVAASPLLLGRGPPSRGAAATLAALERPIFALLVALALLGGLHRVRSWVIRCFSWGGWAVWARLSYGALLLHMPINKALVASRLAPVQLDRTAGITEWFGVACLSYMAALPLALLLELPTQRLLAILTKPPPPHQPHNTPPTPAKADL